MVKYHGKYHGVLDTLSWYGKLPHFTMIYHGKKYYGMVYNIMVW